jgi:hypothetical protein
MPQTSAMDNLLASSKIKGFKRPQAQLRAQASPDLDKEEPEPVISHMLNVGRILISARNPSRDKTLVVINKPVHANWGFN